MKHRFLQILTVATVLLIAGSALAQSSRPGMGATPYADSGGGTTFRVWSPNSSSVSVAGEFNGWSSTAHPLTQEGSSGIWSTDVPGATHGQQYKYVMNGSWTTSWKDPRARWSTYTGAPHTSGANSIIYDPNLFDWEGDTRLSPWQNDLVIYEMHVGSFYDPNPGDGKPGTFYDAVTKLDHLAALGINGVELLPVSEFRGDYSWGYNPADIYAVENAAYGGPDGLKTFVKEAHRRGISVFLDQVHNHYGPDEMDLWDFDTYFGPGIYFYPGSYPSIGVTPWGQRPNYSSEGVRSFIIDNFRMWMDEYHIDGFRWDSVGSMREYDAGGEVYNPIPDGDSLISYINNTLINAEHPGVISIAEDRPGSLGFDGEWAHADKDTIVSVTIQPTDDTRSMTDLWNAINGSGHFRVLFTESHDTAAPANSGARLPYRIDSGNPGSYFARKRATLAALAVLSAPAVPMLFMGQEMLEDQGWNDDVPLDWNHLNYFPGINKLFRDVIHLRRNLDGVSLGMTGPNVTLAHLGDNNAEQKKMLAYYRWGAGADDQVLVVMNFANKYWANYDISGLPADGNWFVHVNSDWTEYGPDFGNLGSKMVTVSGGTGTFSLAPYSFLILSRQALPWQDADSDGLLNGWEEQYYDDPVGALASNDDDGDHMTNIEEAGADTHPLNSNSVFRIHDVQFDPGGIEVRWQGGVAATQILRRASNPVSPVWEDIHTNPPPTAISNAWTDVSPVPDAVIYRVEAVPGS